MDPSSRYYAHSAPSQPSALTSFLMSDGARNAAFNRSKPPAVYIPSRQIYQPGTYVEATKNRNPRSDSYQTDSVGSIPSSPSESSRLSYRSSSSYGSYGSSFDSISTTAPPSPSSFDYYSPPSIGYIDTSLLSSRTRVKDSPDFMSIEPNEIFSPSTFRFPRSDNYQYTLTPPSSNRQLNSSAPSSTQSTPFSSRSRYLVNVPNTNRSQDQPLHNRRFDNVDDFTNADITPPHLFNSPILCPVTNHPFNASLMELPSSPVHSPMLLSSTLVTPMAAPDSPDNIPLYEPAQSRSGYSPYLSPQTRLRSLHSTVLASMQDRTISARLGNNLDMGSFAHDFELSTSGEQYQTRSRGTKRDRDADNADNMNTSDDDTESSNEDVVEPRQDPEYVPELITPPGITKSASSRSRLRTRETNSLVRSKTAPVENANVKLGKCEHCKALAVNPRYGTGRFCGPKCARTFSIKQRYEKMQAAKAATQKASKPRRPRVIKQAQASEETYEHDDDESHQMEEDYQSDLHDSELEEGRVDETDEIENVGADDQQENGQMAS